MNDLSPGATPAIGSVSLDEIAVLGCTSLGREIASLASMCGMKVQMHPVGDEDIASVKGEIAAELERKVATWAISDSEARALLSRITTYTSVDGALKRVGVVLDCSALPTDGKAALLADLDGMVPPEAVIAVALGSSRLEPMLGSVGNPRRYLGFRLMTPAWDNTVAEVIPADFTAQAALDLFAKFLRKIGKSGLKLEDHGGNLSVRAFLALLNEAIAMCGSNGVSPAEADAVLRDMLGMRFGPFELCDRMGLPVVRVWFLGLDAETGNGKVPALLDEFIAKGRLGMAVGAGFLDYSDR
jgi:3-hydroxyacyl-CoA dehydrogenase